MEAGIRNAAATFGAHLDPDQLLRLKEIAAATDVRRFQVFYDRDSAGRNGQAAAIALINAADGLAADGFDWDITFPSPVRGPVPIPETVSDPGEFSREQLLFLRTQGCL